MGLNCQISIEKPKEGVHRDGQVVTGRVKYAVDKPKEYKDIVLSFTGVSRCFWQTHNGQKGQIHSGHQQIFKNEISILCKKVLGENIILQGEYEYEFAFSLPENIPRTFKDKIGSVSYEISVTFKKAGALASDKIYDAVVPVHSYLTPDSEGPAVFNREKSLLAPFSGRKSIIHLKAEISKNCLIPGENVHLNYMVINDTDVAIAYVRTDLYCHTKYTTADKEVREEVNKIKSCKVLTPRVAERSASNFSCVLPTLPDLYSVQHSRVLCREYRVRATVKLPLPHFNATLEIPVLIGDQRETRSVEPRLEVE